MGEIVLIHQLETPDLFLGQLTKVQYSELTANSTIVSKSVFNWFTCSESGILHIMTDTEENK